MSCRVYHNRNMPTSEKKKTITTNVPKRLAEQKCVDVSYFSPKPLDILTKIKLPKPKNPGVNRMAVDF